MEENPYIPLEITTQILGYAHQPYERILSRSLSSQNEYIEKLRLAHLDKNFPNWRNLPQSALLFYAQEGNIYMLNFIKLRAYGHIRYELIALLGAKMGLLRVVLWALYSKMVDMRSIVETTTSYGHLSLLQEYERLNLLYYYNSGQESYDNLYNIILSKAGEKNDQNIIAWALPRANKLKYHYLIEGSIDGYQPTLFWETLDRIDPRGYKRLLTLLLDKAIERRDLGTVDRILSHSHLILDKLSESSGFYYLKLSPDLETFIYLYHKMNEPDLSNRRYERDLVQRFGKPFIMWLKKNRIPSQFEVLYTRLGDLEELKKFQNLNYQTIAEEACYSGHIDILLWVLEEAPGITIVNNNCFRNLGKIKDLPALQRIMDIEEGNVLLDEFTQGISSIALSALMDNNYEVFQWILDTYTIIDYPDLISEACEKGRKDIVRDLIMRMKISSGNKWKNDINNIPVNCIIEKGYIKIIQDLLKEGYTKLDFIAVGAIWKGNLDILHYVINLLPSLHTGPPLMLPNPKSLIRESILSTNVNIFLWLINTFPQDFSYKRFYHRKIITENGLFDFLRYYHQWGISLFKIIVIILNDEWVENKLLTISIILNIYQREITPNLLQSLLRLIHQDDVDMIDLFQAFGKRHGYIVRQETTPQIDDIIDFDLSFIP